ncbi:hypothetical protein [Planctomyces sp. SH-PL62]|uniref:hypothetical protein n=1 Tax=Planctomyces sp. SH-PL62 TaxID=1636152 RepID=UPI00078D3B92|nr:hypothetical protein [Planctomyces sp. SH-PL62]AMV40537.1 hypothetical protein VT85_24115 [Planctomyces sp. SH-PL62]
MVVDDGPEKSGAACCEGCASKPGASSGIWSGEYRCPEGSGRRPVAFTAFLLQERDGIEAMIREANTFGDDRSPRLHATAEGRYDGATRTLQFVKSYDGTGGVSHDVGYKGTVSSDSAQILEGTWDIAGYQGTYTMKRKAVVE